MPEAINAVTIHRPPNFVFAFIADGENSPKWRTSVLDIQRVSGEGKGARYAQGVTGPMGRRVAADYEITVYLPSRRLDFQTIAGPVRPHGRYDLEEIDLGTRLTFSLNAQFNPIQKLLMGSAVQRTMDAEMHSLEDLKRVLER